MIIVKGTEDMHGIVPSIFYMEIHILDMLTIVFILSDKGNLECKNKNKMTLITCL